MFITDGLFDKLMCCGRKEKSKSSSDGVSEGGESDIVMMQHNNNVSEYVTAEQLKEVGTC